MDPDLVSPERLDPDSVNGRPDSKFNSAKEKWWITDEIDNKQDPKVYSVVGRTLFFIFGFLYYIYF